MYDYISINVSLCILFILNEFTVLIIKKQKHI